MGDWKTSIDNFSFYLQIEKGLSKNTLEAYNRDIEKLSTYLSLINQSTAPEQVSDNQIWSFIQWLGEYGISARSVARIISGIKAFYRYLLFENIIDSDPTELIETPRLSQKLPEVLDLTEIDAMIDSVDLSKDEGQRNRAIIETLYSCGLRVTELCNIQLSNMFLDEGFIKITGKGNKERLVPISKKAIKEITLYIQGYRVHMDIKPGHEDFLFLNRRGRQLTRVMIFTIVKQLATQAGVEKNVSPHTFRHSFATHLVDGGADLRAVQDMLGHESILTTEIYTHLDRSHLRSAIEMYHPRSSKRDI